MKDSQRSENEENKIKEQEKEVNRITFSQFGNQILQYFNFEKGILKTIRLLVLNPGEHIHAYLDHDRKRLMNPFKFYVITGTIYVFLFKYALPQEAFEEVQANSELEQQFLEAFVDYYHFFILVVMLFIAVFSYLLFKRSSGKNMLENIIFNLYVAGLLFIISILASPLELFFQPYGSILLSLVSLFYFLYAYVSFFRGSRIITILKSALSMILGVVSLMLIIIFIGIIVGIISTMNT